jgi:hypothetical protein
MKIKLLVSVAGLDFSYAAGEIVDAPQHIAEDMLRAQYAVPVEGESEDEKPKRGRPKKLD